ncbi:acetolactate synthase 2 catalytic subunit [Marinobacter persicus]|uniref:Acetolactate synthase n=1 Tax=Marinobacter persicus TaxID=930118 RepID=A0A2S6G4T0_9GAMM|nr:acetolactate synthase 2 catalytic subunit [Marinobacter persicus]KXS51302.1 MAG: acetolactate synthase I/II/III large subunit [Marinobacter sp. T13-3]PPK50649.1 acetolactate synthase large subunit [Marinobacter persicus]PPK53987.1 acetolactate synthase large subunit [Marinobacter persicus]PPK57158.1 acetolactate synthase large subunit [Marinobacter persicus]
MNGAQHILDAFHRHHIGTVFGYPGGCIMPLYDALVDDVGVEHVLCRHEQACALAADGYARASGKLGVCIATSGPGATNLITGVANAHRDSIPMLVITGQVASGMIGTDAFQETDVLGMTLGIVKHSYLVDSAEDIPAIMEEAMALAQSGRPGPVWIDIPKDILLTDVKTPTPEQTQTPSASTPDLSEALAMLREAKRPLLYSGGGVSLANAEDSFRAFAEASAMPGVATLKGIGNAGKHNPNDLGMLGMHGSRAANRAVEECDLLFIVGARLDDRATGKLDGFAPNARTIHIDADAAEINKLRATDVALRGDLSGILTAFTHEMEAQPLAIDDWRTQCQTWRTTGGFQAADNEEPLAPITGPAFIRQLSRITPDNAIIACDVGQHQMWVAQHYHFNHPRHHLTSGGLGTMGYGLPAAIGAQFADRQSTVINVTGDGSFMMNAQELATIRRYNLPLKLIILDNQCLGMVRQQQELFYNNRESQIDLDDNPDFVAMARAFDIPSLHIERTDQIRRGIETILAYDGPMLLHVAISREENVWPIVKPGASNKEMIDEPKRTTTAKKEQVA